MLTLQRCKPVLFLSCLDSRFWNWNEKGYFHVIKYHTDIEKQSDLRTGIFLTVGGYHPAASLPKKAIGWRLYHHSTRATTPATESALLVTRKFQQLRKCLLFLSLCALPQSLTPWCNLSLLHNVQREMKEKNISFHMSDFFRKLYEKEIIKSWIH